MISRENYKEAHIRELQASSKGDPGLIERTLYAFGLNCDYCYAWISFHSILYVNSIKNYRYPK